MDRQVAFEDGRAPLREASTDLQSLDPRPVSTGKRVLDHRLGLPTDLGNHQLQVGRSWHAIVETGARVASLRGLG